MFGTRVGSPSRLSGTRSGWVVDETTGPASSVRPPRPRSGSPGVASSSELSASLPTLSRRRSISSASVGAASLMARSGSLSRRAEIEITAAKSRRHATPAIPMRALRRFGLVSDRPFKTVGPVMSGESGGFSDTGTVLRIRGWRLHTRVHLRTSLRCRCPWRTSSPASSAATDGPSTRRPARLRPHGS